jgi:uncharacterized repeat protein (TIGR01451 family)
MPKATRAICFVLAIVSMVIATTAFAGSSVGSFEIEGNLADDTGPGEPIDWATPPPNLITFTDNVGRPDDVFGQGSKELEPGTWQCPTSSAPPKDDIKDGAIATRLHEGKQYLYINYTRAGVNGDAHMDYEFNQSSVPNPSCPSVPQRTDGDIVIAFDTEQGGKQIFVRAFRWTGTATVGTLTELSVGSQGVTWDGAVNIPNTIAGHEAGDFGEAALNLTDTIGTIACGQFATAYMKTRASTSIAAELKDRTATQTMQGFCPKLALQKAADRTEAGPGDTITYTLTYSNSGDGPATNVTINESVPAGTEFVSCSDSCTTNGSSVSWSIGTVPPGGGGSVTLTLRVLPDAGCEICNVATISSTDEDPISSNEVCIRVIPEARPELANAHDSAFGAQVVVPAVGLNQTFAPVSSSQSGVGSDSTSDQELNVDVPFESGSILQADVMRTSSTSTVTASPAEAVHTSVAETVNLNVLDGLVTASAVRAVATTRADGGSSSFSSLGSAFKDLFVDADGAGGADPVAYNNVNPNTTVDLSAAFGVGSYVTLFEQIGTTSSPTGLSGGTYAADLTVNMIHVHLTDALPGPLTPGDQTADVIVANAVAHSDFPQTTVCAVSKKRSVSGHAFIASEQTDPSALPVLFGYVDIPPTGGHAHQDLDAFSTSVLTVEASTSDSEGTVTGNNASASSYAEANSVCALPGTSGCAVSATVVRSQSNSAADASGAASNDGGTQFLGVTVLGIPVASAPPRNTVLELPGIGYVILNEQFCDNGAALPSCADGTGHAGLTVRAIHIVVTVPGNPLGLAAGAEVIVAEAHSDAAFK